MVASCTQLDLLTTHGTMHFIGNVMINDVKYTMKC